MKKIINTIIVSGLIWLSFTQNVGADSTVNYTEAKIISANYQGPKLQLQLEIDHIIYNGKFNHPIDYEEYMFLHHNAGSLIHISYQIDIEDQIIILRWSSTDK